jgi:hypothetical protein
MKRSILPVTALAAMLLYASCKSGEPVNLKLNLQPGSQYAYAADWMMDMQMSAMGQNMKTQQNMTMESTYDVAAGAGNNKNIKVSFDRIAMEMKMPMGSMSYDTKDPSKGNPNMAMIGNILHKPFTMEVSEQGEIKKVDGLSTIINSIGDTSTAEGAAMRQQMASAFSDSMVKSLMQQSLNIFPDHPVRPGDTWKNEYNINVGAMSMRLENEFKLKDVTGNTAHLDINSKITGGGAGTGAMQGGTISLSGDQKGTIDVEVATGVLTEGKIKQNIKGDMSMMGMKIPATITQDIHLTAKKK